MDRAVEEEHLRKAEADIAEAHARIERQRTLLARLEMQGHDTATAKSVLQTMHETLALMEQHRRLILQELSR
jgi:hypothetical protein